MLQDLHAESVLRRTTMFLFFYPSVFGGETTDGSLSARTREMFHWIYSPLLSSRTMPCRNPHSVLPCGDFYSIPESGPPVTRCTSHKMYDCLFSFFIRFLSVWSVEDYNVRVKSRHLGEFCSVLHLHRSVLVTASTCIVSEDPIFNFEFN